MANPLDKFELGIRKLIEDLMIERMGENDKIVTRYMADKEFQGAAFPILAKEIFEAVRSDAAGVTKNHGPLTFHFSRQSQPTPSLDLKRAAWSKRAGGVPEAP